MPLLSFGIAWFGYALLSWGVATVRSCNVSFTQIAWPGKFTGCNPDAGTSPGFNQGGTAGGLPTGPYGSTLVPPGTSSSTSPTNPLQTKPGASTLPTRDYPAGAGAPGIRV